MYYYCCVIYCVFSLVCCFVCENVENELEYIGNPDNDSKIERPCPVYDLNCIRDFFAKHSHCHITRGPIPSSIFRSQANYELPRINVSSTLLNEIVTGVNTGRIEEFYVNRKTNRLVISVEFRGLGINSNDSYFSFYRRAKEPIVTVDFTRTLYFSVVTTAVFPHAENLQLKNAEVTVYCNDFLPPFAFGPSVAASTDPTVQTAILALIAEGPNNIGELFLGDAYFYLASYIQYNICDFGLLVL